MGRKVTEDEVKEWVALHEKGHTYDDIGKRVGRDGKTVGKHVRQYLERRGQGSPQDPELDMLKREKERYQVLMELDRLREEREGLPKRLEGFEAELNDLRTTIKALSADQDLLREWFESLPIMNLGRKWKCSQCDSSEYVAVKVECSRCGYETTWGHQCPPEKKVKPALPEY